MESRSLVVESARALVEVVAEPAYPPQRTVGLAAMSREGKGWTQLTPAEARAVATALLKAADEVEGGEPA